MENKSPSRAAPIVAAILLLLPVFYVGAYLALVRPAYASPYRVSPQVCSVVFYPLEQFDRKVRPNAWAHYHF
jgi:hypothetical protein